MGTPIEEITTAYISELIAAIVQSGGDLGIDELEFLFVIDPASLAIGRGKAKRPSWDKGVKYAKTWTEWEDDQGPITCAAVALTFLISPKEDDYRKHPAKASKAARELQTKLGWGESVAVHQFQDFVNLYEKYKVVIFLPFSLKSPYQFKGSEYIFDGDKNILHVTWDPTQLHYAALANPQAAMRNIKNSNYNWCHGCSQGYGQWKPHTCDYHQHVIKKYDLKCRNCNERGKHNCSLYTCRTCRDTFQKGSTTIHRCAVITDIRKEEANNFLRRGDTEDGSKKALISYDLESKFNTIRIPCQVPSFNLDEEGYYTDVVDYSHDMLEHEANMVCYKVAFHGQEGTFTGKLCIRDFIEFLLGFNKGNNICIAHNGSGYDIRLVFRALGDFVDAADIRPIMRGTKLLQLKINKLVFRDSLLHLPGSLKDLGREMASGMALKGFFPYLFNTDDNQSYIGPIPALTFFGTSYKSISERDALRKWHSEWTGDWDFQKELKAYCVNDVAILAKIIEEYHDAQMKMTGSTPWLSTTAPSFIHHVTMEDITKKMEIQDIDPDEYKIKIQKAAEEGFAVLKPFEYNFAMKAFRGGRTDNRVFQRKLTDEEIERGCRIIYLDVVSLYPYVQMDREYPCGYPEIIYWDPEFAPCLKKHYTKDKCDCASKQEIPHLPKEGKIKSMVGQPQPTRREIMSDPTFNGFVSVTLEAPKNLVHAVLVRKDEELGKCISSLADEHNKEIYTSVAELKVALRDGYKLVRVHRLDKYKFKAQPWDLLPKWYLAKMINSGDEPATEEEKEELVQAYEKFGMAEEVRNSFGTWVSKI